MSDGAQNGVRLLFDENLSEQLVRRLQDVFPGSAQVRALGHAGASDRVVWELARTLGCVLVTRDDDFLAMATLQGSLPKVVLIQRANPSNGEIEAMLRAHAIDIGELVRQNEALVMVLR